MAQYLNQELGFDEVRWATLRRTSYDSLNSFRGVPDKVLLPAGTVLFRLVPLATGRYFNEVWWMPRDVFDELRQDANQSSHGGGRLLRNYVAQYMALPSGDYQLSFVEIQLIQPVWAWVGQSAALFGRPGGMQQVFLPNLAERGDPGWSTNATLVHTYSLKF
ncbi:MAG: hypothetical protein NTY38_14745 [Acidobacteria bacterium]|nr:hypothetical protein [Acidobacteriota bacterium]